MVEGHERTFLADLNVLYLNMCGLPGCMRSSKVIIF